MKRIIKLILVVLMSFSMFVPNIAQTVKALPTLEASFDQSTGVLSWTPPAGVSYYKFHINTGGGNHYPSEGNSRNFKEWAWRDGWKTGDYDFWIQAFDSSNSAITEKYTGIYHYVSEGQLSDPQNLHWEGSKAVWNPVENAEYYWFYLYKIDDSEVYYTFHYEETSFDFTGTAFIHDGEAYYFKVCAVNEHGYSNSNFVKSPAETLDGVVWKDLQNVELSPAGVLTWDPYEGADDYGFAFRNVTSPNSPGGGYIGNKTEFDLVEMCKKFSYVYDIFDVEIYALKKEKPQSTERYLQYSNKYTIYDFHYDEIYTITLNNNGIGTEYEPVQAIRGTEFRTVIKYYDLHPTAEGYVFDGWYYDPECTDMVYSNDDVTGNTTLYAHWLTPIDTIELSLNKFFTYGEYREDYILSSDSSDYFLGGYGWLDSNLNEYIEEKFSILSTYYLNIELCIDGESGKCFKVDPETGEADVTVILDGVKWKGVVYPIFTEAYTHTLYFRIPLVANNNTDGKVYLAVETAEFHEGSSSDSGWVKQEGSIQDFRYVMPGEPVTVIAIPKDGNSFKYWTDWSNNFISYDNPYGFKSYKASTYMLAHFDKANTVSFSVKGGSSVEDQYVATGNYAVRPADPTWAGHVFVNWYTDETYSTVFDFDHTPITADTVIYGKYNEIVNLVEISITAPVEGEHPDRDPVAKEPDKYSVAFSNWYLNVSPYPEVNAGDTFEGNKEYVLRVKVTPKDGYAFTFENTEFLINGLATECYGAVGWRQIAYITEDLLDVTFDSMGGSAVEPQKVAFGNKVTKPADPVKEGFLFVGWYRDSAYQNEYDFDSQVTENFTLYAKWTEYCTVTFVTNGDTPNFEVKVEKGGKVECPADPVREGFRFAGWCADASLTTAYEFSTIINEDISIYGSWKQIFTHQVTFLNYDNSDYAVQYVIEGETATKPADPERVGYKFVGWVIDPNDDVLFDFSTPIMSYLHLYSKWELIPEDERDYCFIEFNSNGGGGTVPETIKVDKGSEYTLPECMFTPFPGTEFGYWSTISIKENATLESELKPGTKIKVEEDIQLMAMWVINTIRLAGANRYETAIKAAEEMKARLGVEKFNVVILTTGDNFADALSGGFLAARNDAPILLTRERSYETVNNYIKNNLVDGGKVYVLGGVQAVPEKCLKGLEGFTIKRIAGANRYETNLKILDEADAKHFAVQVCTGNNFADSLSASATGLPIILVKDELSDTQKNYLKTLGTEQFYVIGGKAAVSDKVIDQLKKLGSVKRVAGNNRYETSVEIAKEFFGTHVDRVVLAYAKNFPDGLAGGPLGFEYNAPVILTMTGHEAEAVRYCKDAYPDAAFVMGGSSLISDTAVRKILDMKSSDKIFEK